MNIENIRVIKRATENLKIVTSEWQSDFQLRIFDNQSARISVFGLDYNFLGLNLRLSQGFYDF